MLTLSPTHRYTSFNSIDRRSLSTGNMSHLNSPMFEKLPYTPFIFRCFSHSIEIFGRKYKWNSLRTPCAWPLSQLWTLSAMWSISFGFGRVMNITFRTSMFGKLPGRSCSILTTFRSFSRAYLVIKPTGPERASSHTMAFKVKNKHND